MSDGINKKRDSDTAADSPVSFHVKDEASDLIKFFLYRRGIDVEVKMIRDDECIVTATNVTRGALRAALETIVDLEILEDEEPA